VRSKNIHIGTSGWSYKEWKGAFYPKDVKQADWLGYYAQHYKVTEINTSFYHLPKVQTVLNWAQAVPKDFLFCPKMSRYITHMKKLLEPEEPLQRFFDVFDNIKDYVGPVLIQLPPQLKYDRGRTEHFFNVLRKTYGDYDFALEVRHTTWMEDEPLALMRQYDIGFVISQSGAGFPYAETVTAKHIYVRFHGPRKLYGSSYSEAMLKDFAAKFAKWIRQRHSVWAFFNNDMHGYAINDARRLLDFMAEIKER
jgi:uncharacterized protein YecE (DUF72 family)